MSNLINTNIMSQNKIDINTILENKDKMFGKFVMLCYRHNISLFKTVNSINILSTSIEMLNQCDIEQKKISLELSQKIADVANNEIKIKMRATINSLTTEYDKKLKEIEIIIFFIENKFNDDALEKICCAKPKKKREANKTSDTDKQDKHDKQAKVSKYIATYSN